MSCSVIAINYRHAKNVGDQKTDPTDYFPFAGKIAHLNTRQVTGRESCDVLIVGGGAMLGSRKRRLLRRVAKIRAAQKVVWGAGAAQRGLDKEALFGEWAAAVDVFAPREMVGGHFCVPCVSCMSPEFDRADGAATAPVRELGLFANAQTSPFAGAECHNEQDFATVIRYIKESRVLFSTSYHGGYWAALLGKPVLYAPFNDKFDHVPFRANYCRIEDRSAHIQRAQGSPNHGVCEFARARNRTLRQAVQAGGRWRSSLPVEMLYGSQHDRELVLAFDSLRPNARENQALLKGRDLWLAADDGTAEAWSVGQVQLQIVQHWPEPGAAAKTFKHPVLTAAQQLVSAGTVYHASEIRFPGHGDGWWMPVNLDAELVVRLALRAGYRRIHVLSAAVSPALRGWFASLGGRIVLPPFASVRDSGVNGPNQITPP